MAISAANFVRLCMVQERVLRVRPSLRWCGCTISAHQANDRS